MGAKKSVAATVKGCAVTPRIVGSAGKKLVYVGPKGLKLGYSGRYKEPGVVLGSRGRSGCPRKGR